MDYFYSRRDNLKRLSTKSKALLTTVKNAIKRADKRLADFHSRLNEANGLEQDRISGELLTANIYKVKGGMTSITVDDYYSGESATIMLDPTLSAAANAQRYFKRYAKKKRTLEATKEQIEKTSAERSNYDEVLFALENISSADELSDIAEEMAALGLVRNHKRAKNERPSQPLSVTEGGVKILIGKNNVQNERLVRSSSRNDVWLHVKNAHGSHVVIKLDGKPLEDDVLKRAAQLAAYYSQSKSADKVEVDYCLIKHVSKPSGSPPGRVIYTNQKTLFTTPTPIK